MRLEIQKTKQCTKYAKGMSVINRKKTQKKIISQLIYGDFDADRCTTTSIYLSKHSPTK